MSPGVSDKQASTHLALINMAWKKPEEPKLEELSEKEIEAVTMVFRSFETGLREATIYAKVGEVIIFFISYKEIFLQGSAGSYEDAWPEPHGARDNRPY